MEKNPNWTGKEKYQEAAMQFMQVWQKSAENKYLQALN